MSQIWLDSRNHGTSCRNIPYAYFSFDQRNIPLSKKYFDTKPFVETGRIPKGKMSKVSLIKVRSLEWGESMFKGVKVSRTFYIVRVSGATFTESVGGPLP